MSRIKVIHIIPTLSGGGAERLVFDLARFSNREKFEVLVVCLKKTGELLSEFEKNNVIVEFAGSGNWPMFLSFFKLIKILKKLQPNIVHTHLFGGDFYGFLAARFAGIKNIISTEHNLNLSEKFWRGFLKRFIFRYAKIVVAVSEAVKKYLIKFEKVSEDKIKIIHNGVEIEKFLHLEKNYQVSGRDFVIGSIGRLEKQKGYDVLAEAVSGLNLKCVVAGEGMERKFLENKINSLNISDKFQLPGWQKDIKDFLQKLDIFVLPSRWEGFGIVLLEAGLAGLPVIASRVDGIAEIIKDGEDGLLFEPGDHSELADKISFLMNNESECARLGRNLQKKVIENFDIKKIVAEYEKSYLEIL